MIRVLHGDCREFLKTLEPASVQCCVTSPPYYGLRDYGVDGQIGLEHSPDEYVAQMVEVFRGVRRVLRDDGTLWLNLGDSYNAHSGQRKATDKAGAKQATNRGAVGIGSRSVEGLKPKDLIGIPWRVAFALQADGWWLRSAVVWAKPNPMPESVMDRPTSAYEMVFLMAKQERYFYDADAIAEQSLSPVQQRKRENGLSVVEQKAQGGAPNCGVRDVRNARNVWTIATQPYSGAHFATMPPDLAERCIKAGSKPGDTVLDPFGGAGTTGLVADRLNRNAVLIELNPEYAGLAKERIQGDAGMFADVA